MMPNVAVIVGTLTVISLVFQLLLKSVRSSQSFGLWQGFWALS